MASTSTVTFPAQLPERPRRWTSPATVRSSPRVRVLLVEDNPVDAMRIRQLLARAKTADFAIDSVGCFLAAVERLSAGTVDLVLLDLDLPDSLGLATFTALTAAAPAVPVVVLCRPTDEVLGVEAVRLGAQDFVFKNSVSAEGLARVARCAIERHRVVASLRGLSLTDELTGLFNRRGFTTLAQGHLRLAGRTGQQFLLLFVDVDGLKAINDERGHHEGDQVLIRVAEALRLTFRQSDVVARHGGDEFIALALDASGDGGATIRRRLADNIDRCNRDEPESARVSVSVGAVAFDGRLEEPLGVLLAKADQALYLEKGNRRTPLPTDPAAISG